MIKIPFTATALEPLMHGSDQQQVSGNKRMFRRMKMLKQAAKPVPSQFVSDEARNTAAVTILHAVYKAVDKKLKDDYYGYHEQFISNVIAAAQEHRTKGGFFARLCSLCGVSALRSEHNEKAMLALGQFSDEELVWTMRSQPQYLHMIVRDWVANDGQPSLFTKPAAAKAAHFISHTEEIPFISGNSIGGVIRRLMVADYMALLGYDKAKEGVDKSLYHRLMTGGNIESSTSKLDLAKKEQYIRLAPHIGLLGSALGDMTLHSKLKIGNLMPICQERTSKSEDPSYWDMLGTAYGTRVDSSKSEVDIIILQQPDKERNADQMIYLYEVMNTGSRLEGFFATPDHSPLNVAVMYRALHLLKEYAYVGGRSARGHGRMEFSYEVPEGAMQPYLDHVESVKDEARAFFLTELPEPIA